MSTSYESIRERTFSILEPNNLESFKAEAIQNKKSVSGYINAGEIAICSFTGYEDATLHTYVYPSGLGMHNIQQLYNGKFPHCVLYNNRQITFELLSQDIQEVIMSYCDLEDLLSLSKTSKKMRVLVHSSRGLKDRCRYTVYYEGINSVSASSLMQRSIEQFSRSLKDLHTKNVFELCAKTTIDGRIDTSFTPTAATEMDWFYTITSNLSTMFAIMLTGEREFASLGTRVDLRNIPKEKMVVTFMQRYPMVTGKGIDNFVSNLENVIKKYIHLETVNGAPIQEEITIDQIISLNYSSPVTIFGEPFGLPEDWYILNTEPEKRVDFLPKGYKLTIDWIGLADFYFNLRKTIGHLLFARALWESEVSGVYNIPEHPDHTEMKDMMYHRLALHHMTGGKLGSIEQYRSYKVEHNQRMIETAIILENSYDMSVKVMYGVYGLRMRHDPGSRMICDSLGLGTPKKHEDKKENE